MPKLDISQLEGPTPSGNFIVRAIAVNSLTGSATLNKRSKDLGNATDSRLLLALRGWADAILVGAETVRAENYYGALRASTPHVHAHFFVPSRSLLFNLDSQFFSKAYTAPYFLVPDKQLGRHPTSKRAQLLSKKGITILNSGNGTIIECLTAMKRLKYRRILCEGGPSILTQLIETDALDQFYLTLDPRVSSRVETSLVQFGTPSSHRPMVLENLAADSDSTVFLRYRRISTP